MFLTGKAIDQAVQSGEIVISPYTPKHLSPNSYDLTLSPQLLVYNLTESGYLDMRQENPCLEFTIPESGLILQPGTLYIGMTNESAVSRHYIPMLEGRSSMGRLGINTHITAGFGDIGWGFEELPDGTVVCHKPTWTLEISVVHPVRIYPNVRIAQVYFVQPKGEIKLYSGKYSRQRKPQSSKSWQDFKQV